VTHAPSSHTPLSPGTWASLPRICHSLWRVLQTTREPLTSGELARLAGITSSLNVEATPSQVRSTRTALTVLARAGVDEPARHGTARPVARQPQHGRLSRAIRAATSMVRPARPHRCNRPTPQPGPDTAADSASPAAPSSPNPGANTLTYSPLAGRCAIRSSTRRRRHSPDLAIYAHMRIGDYVRY